MSKEEVLNVKKGEQKIVSIGVIGKSGIGKTSLIYTFLKKELMESPEIVCEKHIISLELSDSNILLGIII